MIEMLGNEKYLWFPNLCSSLRSCQVLCYWWPCKCKWYAAGLLPAELLRTLLALVGAASSQLPAPAAQGGFPAVTAQHHGVYSAPWTQHHNPAGTLRCWGTTGCLGTPAKSRVVALLLGRVRSCHLQTPRHGQRCPGKRHAPPLQPCPCQKTPNVLYPRTWPASSALVGCSGNKYEVSEVPAAPQGATQTEQEFIWKGKGVQDPSLLPVNQGLGYHSRFHFSK